MYYFLYKTNLYNFENNVKIIKMTLIAIILIVLLKCIFFNPATLVQELNCNLIMNGTQPWRRYAWQEIADRNGPQ